ncbi:MAG: transporter substrate-binding domain-containing protein [Kiritimatiellae bacterium]|nr:transporter substrate-binding domain-containing protein [Kiritimatiellia bacterium]
MKNRKLSAPLAALCVALLMCSCGTPTHQTQRQVPSDPAIETGPLLRIGCAPNYPPVIFKKNGVITGFEADLARLMAEELGRQPVFVEMDFEDLIPALLDGRIDLIVSGMSITDQRRVRVAFTDPILRVGQMALVRNEDFRTYDNIGILIGKPVIGVEKGTTGALFVERNCRQAKMKTYSSPEKAVQALIRKRIDVVIHDAPVIWWMASQYEADGITFQPQPFTNELIAWGVSPQNQELLEHANAILTRWNEAGTIDKYMDRWLPN